MADLQTIFARAILGGCLLPVATLGWSQTIPSTGFVGPDTNLAEVLALGNGDVDAVRVYGTDAGGYLGTQMTAVDFDGFIPVSALSRVDIPAGSYFFQTRQGDGDTSKWRAIDLAESANSETSIAGVNLGPLPASKTVGVSDFIDTGSLPSDASIEVFFDGEYLGSMSPSQLTSREVTTPEPDANVAVRLNVRLPEAGSSGLNLTRIEVAEGSDVAVEWTRPESRVDGSPLRASEIDRYQLAYATELGGSGEKTLETTNTSATVQDLEIGQSYEFAVRVYDVDGRVSSFSETVSTTAN